jgi:hypothetical protein
MKANNQAIVELETALNRARDDVRVTAQRDPELSSADMLKLREAAYAAWCELEKAKRAGAGS